MAMISGKMLRDATITGSKLANATVTGTQIAAATVTEANLDVNGDPTQYYALTWNGTKMEWALLTATALGAESVTEPKLDISNAAATSNVLTWNGTKMTWAMIGAANITAASITEACLDILDEPGDGEFLKWNGTSSKPEWVATYDRFVAVNSSDLANANYLINKVSSSIFEALNNEGDYYISIKNGGISGVMLASGCVDVNKLANSIDATSISFNADKVDGKDVDDTKATTAYLLTAYKTLLETRNAAMAKAIISITDTPPGAPSSGDRYLVDEEATGAWEGHENDIAEYITSAWVFYTPNDGHAVYNIATETFYVYDADEAADFKWKVMGSFAIGTLDDIPDGSTYLKVAGVNSSHYITNNSIADSTIAAGKLAVSGTPTVDYVLALDSELALIWKNASSLADTFKVMLDGDDEDPDYLIAKLDSRYFVLDEAAAASLTVGDAEAGLLTYTAKAVGSAGNSITIWHKTGAAESISVDGTDIEITLNSGTSTAASVKDLVDNDEDAAALVSVAIDHVGVQPDMVSAENLAGGTDDSASLKNASIIGGKLANDTITATQLASNIDMTSKGFDAAKVGGKVVNDSETTTGYLWTASKIREAIAAAVSGMIWQAPVDSVDVDTPPAEPGTGDRHIVGDEPTGDWVGHAYAIAEFDGEDWVFTAAADGMATYNKADEYIYMYDADEAVAYKWKQTAAMTPHNALSGLQGGTTNQYYHLTSTEHGNLYKVKAASGDSSPDYLDGKISSTFFEIVGDDISIKNLAIGTDQLAADAVTNAKLADDCISDEQLDASNSATDGYVLTWTGGETNQFTWASAVLTDEKVKADSGGTAGYLDAVMSSSFFAVTEHIIGIKNGSIDTTQLANNGVTADKIATSVAGAGLSGGGGSALSVNVANGIKINTDTLELDQAIFEDLTPTWGSGDYGKHIEVKGSAIAQVYQAYVNGVLVYPSYYTMNYKSDDSEGAGFITFHDHGSTPHSGKSAMCFALAADDEILIIYR